MRTIKFRSWDNNKMFVVTSIRTSTVGDICVSNETYIEGEMWLPPTMISDILMQFTGLKDKHGKEIYEGDFVLFEDNKLIHIVEYYENGFILKSIDNKVRVFNIKPDFIEVVGNSYENPELLTVREENLI